MKLLAVFSGFYEQITVFDAAGKVWQARELKSRYQKTWWLSALVHTVFNPWVDTEFVWHEPRAYTLDELKKNYASAVEADDDILTQFVERDALLKEISEASSFTDLARIYRSAQREQR